MAATAIEKAVNTGSVFPKTTFKNIGKETPAAMEDNETIRLANKTIKNTIMDKAQDKGKMQMTIPKMVATPFPPLKPANTGNIWPNKAATPNPSCKFTNSGLPNSKPLKYDKATDNVPFIISMISTGIPAFRPSTLKVLVAPAFPLPNSRTSIP